jgi:flagellar biosynthesis protein
MNQRKGRKAVALRYRTNEDRAPRVVAKGADRIADKIIDLARRHAVPVRQDRNLVEVLAKLDIDKEIPPGLYQAVAEILAFVYRLSNQAPGSP